MPVWGGLNKDVDASFYDGLAVQRALDAVQESASRPELDPIGNRPVVKILVYGHSCQS